MVAEETDELADNELAKGEEALCGGALGCVEGGHGVNRDVGEDE